MDFYQWSKRIQKSYDVDYERTIAGFEHHYNCINYEEVGERIVI